MNKTNIHKFDPTKIKAYMQSLYFEAYNIVHFCKAPIPNTAAVA